MSNVIQFSAAGRISPKRTADIEATAGAIVATVHQMPTEPVLSRRGRPLPEPRTDQLQKPPPAVEAPHGMVGRRALDVLLASSPGLADGAFECARP